jgi:hypothetical protein
MKIAMILGLPLRFFKRYISSIMGLPIAGVVPQFGQYYLG